MKKFDDFFSKTSNIEFLSETEKLGILGGSDLYSTDTETNSFFRNDQEKKKKSLSTSSKTDAFSPNTRIGCL